MGDIYEKVRQRLDMFPQGFPKTASGVELEILRRLFTPEEGEMSNATYATTPPRDTLPSKEKSLWSAC